MLSPERQSARMSKITNDGLARSGTGCFITVPIWQEWASKVNCITGGANFPPVLAFVPPALVICPNIRQDLRGNIFCKLWKITFTAVSYLIVDWTGTTQTTRHTVGVFRIPCCLLNHTWLSACIIWRRSVSWRWSQWLTVILCCC